MLTRPFFPAGLRATLLTALLAVAAWWAAPLVPNLDDGYIALDSAQHLFAVADPHYGVPPLTGVTSPPYMLGIAAVLSLGVPPLAALRVATAAGLLALAVALWWLARVVGLGRGSAFVFGIAVFSAGPVIRQATNGVETGWAMAVAVGLIAACIAERPMMAAAAAGLLPWLRPDLAPMAGVLLIAAVRAQPRAVVLRAVGMAVVVCVPWSAWLHLQTGTWMPQTMATKAAFFAEACRPLAAKIEIASWGIVDWIVVLAPLSVLGLGWSLRPTIGRAGWVAVIGALALHMALLPSGLWHNNHRYLYPLLLPWMALGIAECLRGRKPLWRVVVGVTVAASLMLWPARRWADESHDREAVAAWVGGHVDPRATLLVQDAGVFAVMTENPLVDLVGLKTPASRAAHERWTAPTCGADRYRALVDIASASRARYVVVTSDWDRAYSLTAALRRGGVPLTEVRPAPAGQFGYAVYAIAQAAAPAPATPVAAVEARRDPR